LHVADVEVLRCRCRFSFATWYNSAGLMTSFIMAISPQQD